MANELKVNLTLLKKLVKELEDALEASYLVRDDLDRDQISAYNDFIIEISKAGGLAAGIVSEATLLIGDMRKLMSSSYPASKKNEYDLLQDLLGPKTSIKN